MQNEHQPEFYFAHSASLRIFGEDLEPSEITRILDIEPTHAHRRGERRTPRAAPYPTGGWTYQAPISEEQPLTEHLEALWQVFEGKYESLIQLKARGYKVDVFCGYRSDCDHAGFAVAPHVLEPFTALEIPLNVSVIIAGAD